MMDTRDNKNSNSSWCCRNGKNERKNKTKENQRDQFPRYSALSNSKQNPNLYLKSFYGIEEISLNVTVCWGEGIATVIK